MNKKQIFALADPHGHYTEMINALNKAGFDENNDQHLLIVCGDLFDRGTESASIFEYLYKLTQENKAIVIKGNHDMMMIDFLRGLDPLFNFQRNGMNYTFDDFWGRTNSFGSMVLLKELGNINYDDMQECFDVYAKRTRNYINNHYPNLLEWLEKLPPFYETENYIFTHGSIDTKVEDWWHPRKEIYKYYGWEACAWDDGSFFGESICNTDKTIVIGHFATDVLREIYLNQPRDNNDFSILIRNDKRIVALDACTIVSKKINVYKIENEKLLDDI